MPRNDSTERTSTQVAAGGTASHRALHRSVRQALYGSRGWVRAGLCAAGIAGGIPLAGASPFPPVFHLADLTPPNGGDGSEGFVLPGIDAGDWIGLHLSAAGDVNGDGIDDIVLGTDNSEPNGEIYVIFGSTRGFPAVVPLASLFPAGGGDGSAGFVLVGASRGGSGIGDSLSAAGDVNADGVDDLIVGDLNAAPGGRTSAGESYVVYGSRQGFPAVLPLARLFPPGGGDGSAGFVLTGVDPNDRSAWAVNSAGDIDGDGIADVIIGAPGSRAGEAYVVFGSTRGFPAVFPLASLFPAGGGDGSAGVVIGGIDGLDKLGSAVSAAGDINGDAIDDFVVTAQHTPGGEGYVVFGSAQGFAPLLPVAHLFPSLGGDGSAGFVIAGIDANVELGGSVSAAGDVNGDGIDDIIIADPFADFGPIDNAGVGFVVFGRTQGFPPVLPVANLFPPNGDGSDGFVLVGTYYGSAGAAVGAAGDVNGDGVDDLIVGSDDSSFPLQHEASAAGECYVVFGSTSGFPPVIHLATLGSGNGSVGFVIEGIHTGDSAGTGVSGAGDVNGDGIDDLLIGALNAEPNGKFEAGEAYVVFGRSAAR